MARLLFTGGQVFDGTGNAAAEADVVVEDGRVIELGLGLDGDEAVDCSGATVFPGFFDCHVHVMMSGVDVLRQLEGPLTFTAYALPQDASGANIHKVVEERMRSYRRVKPDIELKLVTGVHGPGEVHVVVVTW